MNENDLKQFLISANKVGYASGKEREWIKCEDGSTTIVFEQGEYRMHDNFFGGEPYGGRLVVFIENKPVWMMVYYGCVIEGVLVDKIYAILRKALSLMPENCPLRGPHSYTEGAFEYVNFWEGDVEKYVGEEQIIEGDKTVYKATYVGGLVDQG